MNGITWPSKQGNFGKDQTVYNDNGLLKCTRCHQITQKGECPKCDHLFELGFDYKAVRKCDDCSKTIEWGENGFALYEFKDGRSEVVCERCSIFNEKIDQENMLQAENKPWFDPELFPELQGGQVKIKQCLSCGGLVPIARVVSKCDNCLEQIGRIAAEADADPAYQAIEAAIESGEAFQCAYCGITDDISQLDNSRPGIKRCQTCAATRQLLLKKASKPIN